MNRKSLSLLLAFLLLLLCGCTIRAPHEGQVAYTQNPLPFEKIEDVELTPEPLIPLATPEPLQIFGVEDMVMADIVLGSSAQDVLSKLGETKAIQTENEGKKATWKYEDLGILLTLSGEIADDLHVDSIQLTSAMAEGPRGIKVGDSLDDILAKFPQKEPVKDAQNQTVYYAQEFLQDNMPLPPCAYLKEDPNGSQILYFLYPTSPYENTINEKKDYQDKSHGIFQVKFQNGKAIQLFITINTLS